MLGRASSARTIRAAPTSARESNGILSIAGTGFPTCVAFSSCVCLCLCLRVCLHALSRPLSLSLSLYLSLCLMLFLLGGGFCLCLCCFCCGIAAVGRSDRSARQQRQRKCFVASHSTNDVLLAEAVSLTPSLHGFVLNLLVQTSCFHPHSTVTHIPLAKTMLKTTACCCYCRNTKTACAQVHTPLTNEVLYKVQAHIQKVTHEHMNTFIHSHMSTLIHSLTHTLIHSHKHAQAFTAACSCAVCSAVETAAMHAVGSRRVSSVPPQSAAQAPPAA